MSQDWSNQRWSQHWDWNDDQWHHNHDQWHQPETWKTQELLPPKVRFPPEWKATATMFDDELLYGHKFHKTVQPSAWGRRKNLCGLNPLTIPIG